ncbi:Cwf19 C-terminal domain-2 [Cordyceps militaris]|uniref:Cwf19 C-terminal domain-2 n=1 Tax=Cordyceps militaris TaxID=73501 RepID=A0A2H4SKN7_CORMI|nr:Cwf19 C-terminal domain-2 [Cordyceps militaris]
MAAPKIIVMGSLYGNLEPAFKKLAALHAKNAFSLAILTGDVFGPSPSPDTISALLAGTLHPPLPTYFSVGSQPLPERIAAHLAASDDDIAPNLHFLGRRSVTKTTEGLRIVSLGGALLQADAAAPGKEQHLPFHTEQDAHSLKGAHGADILLTSTWPAGIWAGGSKVALDEDCRRQVAASACVAELCAALKPRYHLSASPGDFFYEREPFVQAAEANSDVIPVTRFLSMAPYGNAAKKKALYAFTLNKSDEAVPPGTTASPFLPPRDKKRRLNEGDADGASYNRYGNHHQHGRQKRHRASQQPPPGPDQCFFCLSNPRTATHMICSIGEDAYVTTAKGPLIPSAADLALPGHFIIIPLPTPRRCTPSAPVRARLEMARFRDSLQSMLARRSDRNLGVVTWEISRDRNVHLIWQVVAVPAARIVDGLAEAALRVEADRHGYPAFQTRELASLEDEAACGDFVRVWLWCDSDGSDAIRSKTLVMPLDRDMRFDLQMPRRALAKLLELENRSVWQDCQQTEAEETKDADAFREAFKEWDFTLE